MANLVPLKCVSHVQKHTQISSRIDICSLYGLSGGLAIITVFGGWQDRARVGHEYSFSSFLVDIYSLIL